MERLKEPKEMLLWNKNQLLWRYYAITCDSFCPANTALLARQHNNRQIRKDVLQQYENKFRGYVYYLLTFWYKRTNTRQVLNFQGDNCTKVDSFNPRLILGQSLAATNQKAVTLTDTSNTHKAFNLCELNYRFC